MGTHATPTALDRVLAFERATSRTSGRPFKVERSDDGDGLAFGWAYVCIDEAGDVVIDEGFDTSIEPHDLERAVYDMVGSGGGIGDEMHDYGFQCRIVESMVWTREKYEALGLPVGKLGWWIGLRAIDPETKTRMAKGEYPAFSIGARAVEVAA